MLYFVFSIHALVNIFVHAQEYVFYFLPTEFTDDNSDEQNHHYWLHALHQSNAVEQIFLDLNCVLKLPNSNIGDTTYCILCGYQICFFSFKRLRISGRKGYRNRAREKLRDCNLSDSELHVAVCVYM
jgi:hypothetical protein